MEKPTKKLNTWVGALVLVTSIIVIALLFCWVMYERSSSADSKQSLAVVSGKIGKLEKDIETCLSSNKETKEMMKVMKETPCEKPKKKVVRQTVRKPLAPPPAKQVVVPPAPIVARPVVAETKPVVQEAPLPVVSERREERLLDGVDPSFGRTTEEYVPAPTTVVQEEAPPRRVVRSSRVVIMEQPSLPYYDGGYNAGYVQSYPQQYRSYPQQYQYAPAPIYVPPYVPPPRQAFYPAPHVIVPAPSHVVHPGGHPPSGSTSGSAPSGSTGGVR